MKIILSGTEFSGFTVEADIEEALAGQLLLSKLCQVCSDNGMIFAYRRFQDINYKTERWNDNILIVINK